MLKRKNFLKKTLLSEFHWGNLHEFNDKLCIRIVNYAINGRRIAICTLIKKEYSEIII